MDTADISFVLISKCGLKVLEPFCHKHFTDLVGKVEKKIKTTLSDISICCYAIAIWNMVYMIQLEMSWVQKGESC